MEGRVGVWGRNWLARAAPVASWRTLRKLSHPLKQSCANPHILNTRGGRGLGRQLFEENTRCSKNIGKRSFEFKTQLLSLLSVELTDRAAGGMGGSRKAWEVRLSRGGGKGFGFTLIQGVEEEGVFIARYSHISQTLLVQGGVWRPGREMRAGWDGQGDGNQ